MLFLPEREGITDTKNNYEDMDVLNLDSNVLCDVGGGGSNPSIPTKFK